LISGDADEPLGWGRRVPLELRAPAGLPGVRPLESQWDLPLPQCQDVWDVERYVALVREVEEATLDVGGGGVGPRAWLEDTIEACCASNNANQCPGRYMGGKKGGSESQFPYSLPTTKFFEFRWGQQRNWHVSFSPVIPPPDFVSKTFLRDITFLLQSIREPANSSKTHPPLPVCIGLDSVGVSATWVHFHLIPVNAGHVGNLFPFPLFVSPPTHVQFGWEGSPTTFGSVTNSYLVHEKRPFTKCLPYCRSRWASW